MVKVLAGVIAFALLGACGYSASLIDCTISCSSESGCPAGFTCGGEALCRATDATSSCAAMLIDSSVGSEAGPIDARLGDATNPVVLSETVGDMSPTAGLACYPSCTIDPAPDCSQTADTASSEWYRWFRLTDFGITGSFEISEVDFATGSTRGASGTMVTLYTYTPATQPGAILVRTDLAALDMVPVPPLSDLAPATVAVPLSTPVAITQGANGGQFVVEVSSPDLSMGANAGRFVMGNASAEKSPPPTYEAYFFSSNNCTGTGPNPAQEPTQHAIIDVIGYPL